MMVKYFLIFVFGFLLFTKSVEADSQMEIFSDPAYINRTTNFSPRQEVFAKIESEDAGEKEKVVKLKDNQYNDIATFQLVRVGSGPFIYKVSFAAPQAPGFYSVEATIASSGSQNKLVKTIQVGSPANIDTRINVRTEVKGNRAGKLPTPTPTPTPISTPTPTVEPQKPQPTTATQPAAVAPFSFWQKITQFFQSIFKFLFRF